MSDTVGGTGSGVDTIMGPSGPTLAPDPPHGPNIPNQVTHIAMTEEEEADLPIESLPPGPSQTGAAHVAATSTKSDTVTGGTHGSDEQPTKSDTSKRSSH